MVSAHILRVQVEYSTPVPIPHNGVSIDASPLMGNRILLIVLNELQCFSESNTGRDEETFLGEGWAGSQSYVWGCRRGDEPPPPERPRRQLFTNCWGFCLDSLTLRTAFGQRAGHSLTHIHQEKNNENINSTPLSQYWQRDEETLTHRWVHHIKQCRDKSEYW